MRSLYFLALSLAAARFGSAAAVEAGKAAPALNLTQILQAPAGSTATWEAFHGKASVLEFWATWCAPCVEAIPHWNKLAERFKDRPIRFLSITDESPEVIARFLKAKPMSGLVGLDGQGKTFDSFMVEVRPTTVLVDADGIMRAVGHPKGLTEAALDDLLAGKPVTITFESGGADTQALPQSIFEISIRPASPISVTKTSPGGRVKYGKGFITYSITLASILSQVYGVPASRVIGEEWVGRDAYDVALVLPGPAVKETDALKIALELGFRAQVHKVRRDVPVYELRRIEGRELRATPAAGRTHTEGTAGNREVHALPLSWIANLAPRDLGPIFDETGIKGNFDYSLKWNPSDPQSFLAAVREGTGLELAATHRELEFLVVDSAVRPATW
jgi:uncharacterized protein (TIGR03435 family)